MQREQSQSNIEKNEKEKTQLQQKCDVSPSIVILYVQWRNEWMNEKYFLAYIKCIYMYTQDLQSKNETIKTELKKIKEKRRTPAEKTLADLRQQNQVFHYSNIQT